MAVLESLYHQNKIKELQYQVATYEDKNAYKTLFFLLFPSLQNLAFSILKSRALAEEVASDMMLEVWLRRKKLLEIDNLKVYLFVGTRNAAINKLKQENRHARFDIEDLQVEFLSDYATPVESAELQELESRIATAVKELPASCQVIYKLAKEDRLRYKEIAEILNLSVKTIDNQLSIAVKKIARALQFRSAKK